jgi:hypothetical protein
MFDEPSRGSKATTYFPYNSTSTLIAVSSSSESKIAHLELPLSAFMKTSLAITSSFFYSSPVVLLEPAKPNRLNKPALLTLEEMNLQAVAIEVIRSVKSPVASLCFY